VTDTGIRPVDVSHSGTLSVDVRATSHGCQRYVAERRPAVKSVGWNIEKFRGRGSQETGREEGWGASRWFVVYMCLQNVASNASRIELVTTVGDTASVLLW
jgi:hypothetical protein